MSNVADIETVVKLVNEAIKDGEAIVANGGSLALDFTPFFSFVTALMADMPAFSAAVTEFKALDEAGINQLTTDLATDLAILPAKVITIINAIVMFVPAVENMVNVIKGA